MSRLARKFIISISFVFLCFIVFVLYLNNAFVERFYLYEKKKDLNNIYSQMVNTDKPLDTIIEDLENSEEVVIAKVSNTTDNIKINEDLRAAFLEKGLGIEKFWLWEQDYETTTKNGKQLRVYNQGKLNYSLLVEYALIEHNLVGIAMIIPNVSGMLRLINFFQIILFLVALIFMILILYFLVRRITEPISQLSDLTNDIANLDFKTIKINTKDEIQILADNINTMSSQLKTSQEVLIQKNRQMEDLLSNVSHELKTPISLIKAYSNGIKDELDDGTFINTILEQNDRLGNITEKLLDLSRISIKDISLEPVNISEILRHIVGETVIAFKALEQPELVLSKEIEPNQIIIGDKEGIHSILENLITNAVKYTCNHKIQVLLYREEDIIRLKITNGVNTDHPINLNRLWEPFYVGDSSRSKELSGTGLGLSIVKAIAEKLGYRYHSYLYGDEITFSIDFITIN